MWSFVLKIQSKGNEYETGIENRNWIGIGMSEVWFSVFDSEKCCFHSKQKLFTILEMLFRTQKNTKD